MRFILSTHCSTSVKTHYMRSLFPLNYGWSNPWKYSFSMVVLRWAAFYLENHFNDFGFCAVWKPLAFFLLWKIYLKRFSKVVNIIARENVIKRWCGLALVDWKITSHCGFRRVVSTRRDRVCVFPSSAWYSISLRAEMRLGYITVRGRGDCDK